MILLVVWDGLRPDLVSPEHTPFLARMAAQGVTCSASHAVWPTATRINAASLSTGCYPAKHGLVDNELYVPALDPRRAISCADWRALQAMADSEAGPLLMAPTLGEILAGAGRRMVSGGSGSPGTTYLTNPTVTGPIVNWAVAWPTGFEAELAERYRRLLREDSDSVARNRYVIGALRDLMIPAQRPDVVTLWLTEPDHAQHHYGLLSDEACQMLRHVDAEIESLHAHLAATEQDLTCFMLSDHGFDTIGPAIQMETELIAAGFKTGPASDDVVCAGCSLYLTEGAQGMLPRLAEWLLAQSWVGALFVADELAEACPGALPQSAARGGHRRSGQIMYSYRWTNEPSTTGVPGTIYGSPGMAATHGSTSPYTLRNTLIAWGAGIKQGIVSEVPCGIVDVAPTVLHLLGIEAPATMDGRGLDELLTDGPDPQSIAVTHTTRRPKGAPQAQVAHYSVAREHSYLDYVTRG